MKCLIVVFGVICLLASGVAAEVNSIPVFKPACFKHDSIILSKSARLNLDLVARIVLEQPGLSLTLIGHTDDRRTEEYALALGDRLTKVVMNYLTQAGVQPLRITTSSHGKSKPAGSRQAKTVRDCNNLVEIIAQAGEKPLQ